MIEQRFESLLDSIRVDHEFLLPSEWSEKYRKLSSEVSTVQGKFRYKHTPYTKEIIDKLSPYDPAKVIAIMKGSQLGISDGLLINGIVWIIANAPGNILFTSAGDDLSKEMVEMRLDQAIRSCGIEHLIRPNIIKKRNQRTGDTAKYKEFAGGRAFFGGANATDKLSRQRSVRYGFFDDWDAAKGIDKDQGDLFSLLQKRFSTAKNVMKQFYISTPETEPSNIRRVYDMGDQRKWHIPCPKCGEYIELKWNGKTKDGEKFGIDFKKDKEGKLIPKSVGYICQECGKKFQEKEKYKINLKGKWIPTKKPDREGYVSYYMSNLIAAPFMMGWKDFANEHIDIYKDGNERKSKLKVFMNQTLGLPWEEKQVKIKSNQLSRNTRKYEIRTVPNKLSQSDGNGEIVLLTCACDLNGILDDARLDYEVIGHSVTGSTYSIVHGSIGTFKPGNKDPNRDRWTYRNNEPNNVWDFFYNEVVNINYFTDEGGEKAITLTSVDTGYYTHYAYGFIDSYPGQIIGVKGTGDDKFMKMGKDLPFFKPAQERPSLFILQVDLIKDRLAEMISLKKAEPQPNGFMNFPQPSEGLYTVPGYFSQYEAEEKKIEQNDDGEATGWKWVRKYSSAANHFFDVAVYNLATRDIIANKVCKEMKIPHGKWEYFCGIISQM